MEYTVNQEAIKEYAAKASSEMCRQYFVNKAFISGQEILSFHTDNQLNLLIVKNIFLNWQKEVQKLKSPYFDFEDEGVKLALKGFMNKLSNHIKVYRYDFETLVSRSVSDFIMLSAAPAEFFTSEIEQLASPKVTIQLLKDFSKYIRVNRFIIEQAIQEIEAAGYQETFAGETIRFMRKAILENPDKLDQADKALQGLLLTRGASISDFVSEPKPLVSPPVFMEKTVSKNPLADLFEEQKPALENKQPEETPTEEMVNAFDELTIADFSEEDEKENTEMSEIFQYGNADEFENESNVSSEEPALKPIEEDKYTSPGNTANLHETLKTKEQAGLAETLSGARNVAAPFRTLVPMHYRFTFINSLFDGNQDAWAEAVELIDQTYSFEEASDLLMSSYSERFNWIEKEDNVGILLNYIERKF